MNTSAPVNLGTAIGSPTTLDPPGLFRPVSPIAFSPRPGASSPGLSPRPEPVVPPVFAADDFDESRYAMRSESYARILPYLQTLVPTSQPEPRKDKKTEEEKPVERYDHIKDDDFKKTVTEVIDTFKGKEGSGKKRDAVKNAAKEFWNSNLGKKINYADLKEILQAAAAT